MRISIYIVLSVLILWTLLTFWAEYSGGLEESFIGDPLSSKKVLIVYNPDPIYNLDEQVCQQFGVGIEAQDCYVKIATVKAAQNDIGDYDCYVFCANTYNWSPDWLTTKYIANHPQLKNKKVVAITLGAGSTKRAQQKLEKSILSKQANLIHSESFWLMKPNDEGRMNEKNIKVALDMAREMGFEIGGRIKLE